VTDRSSQVHDSSDEVRHEAARITGYYGRRVRHGFAAARPFLLAERRRFMERLIERDARRLEDIRICDVGCGGGADLAFWAELGVPTSQLAGTELLEDRVELARTTVPGADIRHVTGFNLPFDDHSFDLTSASLVLSMVRDDPLRRRLFEEMWRVTAPGGLVVIYDMAFSKPWNRGVVSMNRRRLESLGPQPDETRPAAPFLPLLAPAVRLPRPLRRLVVSLLPRTHRLWVWRVPGAPEDPVAGGSRRAGEAA
jgi:SAM-dependent methyltransferase